MAWCKCQRDWRVLFASVSYMLAWVAWIACLREWRANVDGLLYVKKFN